MIDSRLKTRDFHDTKGNILLFSPLVRLSHLTFSKNSSLFDHLAAHFYYKIFIIVFCLKGTKVPQPLFNLIYYVILVIRAIRILISLLANRGSL